jgi:hypothetical protein
MTWDYEYNIGEATEERLDQAASQEKLRELDKPRLRGSPAGVQDIKVETNHIQIPKITQWKIAEETNHPLYDVYRKAIRQALDGKGQERHGQQRLFEKQPWVTITDTHGLGFLTGQAEKKLREAFANKDKADDAWFEKELLGALNYIAMALLYKDMQRDKSKGLVAMDTR